MYTVILSVMYLLRNIWMVGNEYAFHYHNLEPPIYDPGRKGGDFYNNPYAIVWNYDNMCYYWTEYEISVDCTEITDASLSVAYSFTDSDFVGLTPETKNLRIFARRP